MPLQHTPAAMAGHLSGCCLPSTCVHCQCHRSSRRIEVDVTGFARSDGTSSPSEDVLVWVGAGCCVQHCNTQQSRQLNPQSVRVRAVQMRKRMLRALCGVVVCMREVSCRSCRRVPECVHAATPGGGAPALVSHQPRARHKQSTPETPVCGRCACCRSLW